MLDQNLFTLFLTPSPSDPTILNLTDPSGQPHYTRRRIPGPTYTIELYDPTTQGLLIRASAPSPTTKHKTLELCNPPVVVELKYTGTLSFRWSFQWEEHQFEWKREECFIIRKPDPPVLVAVTKEPPGKLKTTLIQLLDYNLNRFDINDRKGLEIVILTALLTFQDSNEAHHSPNSTPGSSTTPSSSSIPTLFSLPSLSSLPSLPSLSSSSANSPHTSRSPSSSYPHTLTGPTYADEGDITPPPPPPKPPLLTGPARIAELQALRSTSDSEYNQVTVFGEGDVADYGRYIVERLLGDDAILFVVVKSAPAPAPATATSGQVQKETMRLPGDVGGVDTVQKVVKVVEWVKRERYKAGEDDIHQYVQYDFDKAKKGPRIINLDDRAPKVEYTPPQSLMVHLSKIPMPELAPRAKASTSPFPTIPEDIDLAPASTGGKKDKAKEKAKEKEGKKKKENKSEKERDKERDKDGKKALKKKERPTASTAEVSQTPQIPQVPQMPQPPQMPQQPQQPLPPSSLSPSRTLHRISTLLSPSSHPGPPPPFSPLSPLSPSSSSQAGALNAPQSHPSHRPSRTPAHQPHAFQPSPSPSQLNNPLIYTSPPPVPPVPPRPPRQARQSWAFGQHQQPGQQQAGQQQYYQGAPAGQGRGEGHAQGLSYGGVVDGIMSILSRRV